MSLFDVFKKEAECAKCRLLLPKKHLGTFDTTHQGKRKEGEKLLLCPSCMVEALIKQFLYFHEKAVVVYPSKKFNAYVFYQFKELENNTRSSIASDIYMGSIGTVR